MFILDYDPKHNQQKKRTNLKNSESSTIPVIGASTVKRITQEAV